MRSHFSLLVALLVLAPVARADVKQRSVTRAGEGSLFVPVGLAVGPEGAVHVSSEGVDERLHYTRIDGKHETDQVVDPDPMLGNLTAIALDSAGHPHITYNVVRDQEGVLTYASFDGAAWQIEHLGPQANALALAIDAGDQPHIAAQIVTGGTTLFFQYIHRDGSGWHYDQPTGSSAIMPFSLALDSDGHAHVGAQDRKDSFTSTPVDFSDASGDWVETDVSDPNAAASDLGSIALDSLGHLHAVLATQQPTTVRYRHFDGVQWLSEVLIGPDDLPPGVQQSPQSVSIALDAQDRPSILLMDQLSKNDVFADVVLYAYKSGNDWIPVPLAKGRGDGHWTQLVAAPDGASIAAYGRLHGDDSQTIRVARIAVPDLTGTWSSLTVTPMGGTWRVDGTLQVTNAGSAKAKGAAIGFYLSSDSTLDLGDVALKQRKKCGGLAPGASKTIKVSLEIPAPVGPLELIAVLDPKARRDDRDRSNNAIAGPLAK